MKSVTAGLVAGLLGACAGQAPPVGGQPAAQKPRAAAAAITTDATPALWRVKGTHGSVYLFGSVHVMRKDVKWESARVKDALKSSDVLYLEIADIDPASMAAMQPAILQLGMDQEHPLSSKISKEDVELLDTALKQMGMPGEAAFEPMQPWLAYLTLSVLPALQAGYDPTSGIDQVVLAEAKAENKPVKGFETAEQQLHYLADFPQAEQVQMLHQTLTELPKGAEQMNDIMADWTRGDVEAIGALDNDEMKVKTPVLYEKLLVKRNERFAEVLAGLLKDPATGTVFVTIGAGHLAGADSVIKMLEKKGFVVERVE